MARTTEAAAAAAQSRKDSADFNHKAVFALAERGYSREAIATLLGISVRTVRNYQSFPCSDYEAERDAVRKRDDWERLQRTVHGSKPFLMDFVYSPEEVAEWRSNGLRGDVKACLDRGMSQAEIARFLGRSRQIISYHVKALRVSDKPVVLTVA